jgi:hypothetical protein
VLRLVFRDFGDGGQIGERDEEREWPLVFGVGSGQDGGVEEVGGGHAPVFSDLVDEVDGVGLNGHCCGVGKLVVWNF